MRTLLIKPAKWFATVYSATREEVISQIPVLVTELKCPPLYQCMFCRAIDLTTVSFQDLYTIS